MQAVAEAEEPSSASCSCPRVRPALARRSDRQNYRIKPSTLCTEYSSIPQVTSIIRPQGIYPAAHNNKQSHLDNGEAKERKRPGPHISSHYGVPVSALLTAPALDPENCMKHWKALALHEKTGFIPKASVKPPHEAGPLAPLQTVPGNLTSTGSLGLLSGAGILILARTVGHCADIINTDVRCPIVERVDAHVQHRNTAG